MFSACGFGFIFLRLLPHLSSLLVVVKLFLTCGLMIGLPGCTLGNDHLRSRKLLYRFGYVRVCLCLSWEALQWELAESILMCQHVWKGFQHVKMGYNISKTWIYDWFNQYCTELSSWCLPILCHIKDQAWFISVKWEILSRRIGEFWPLKHTRGIFVSHIILYCATNYIRKWLSWWIH